MTDSDRVRALLATGVIAVSGGLTASSVASETDSGQEGMSSQPDASGDQVGQGTQNETPLPVPVHPVYGDPGQDAPVDPPAGGDASPGAPLEVVAPEGVGSGDLEAVDPGAPESSGSEPVGSEPVAPEPNALQPDTSAPSAPRPLGAEPIDPPSGPHPFAPPSGETVADPAPIAGGSDRALRAGRRRVHGGVLRLHVVRRAPVRLAEAVDQVPAVAAQAVRVAGTRLGAGSLSHARFHVVRPGDSLWAIASALLGPQASSGDVARKVRRLWRLNRHRIGTGDPGELPVGVRLRLR